MDGERHFSHFTGAVDDRTKSDSGSLPIGIEGQVKDGVVSNRQAYITFAIVALALLMASIDATIVAVSLPTMLAELNTTLAWVGWTMTGYQFSQSIIMPIAGKLSDDLGRKRLFLAAAALFTIASMAAGAAPNIFWLIVFRVIQGIGGGAFMPSATGIISDAFGRRRGQWIGLFGSILPIGGILGPNIGGFIIDRFSWRWIFFVNVPIGVLLVLLGAILLPRSRPANGTSRRQMDFTGLALFIGALLSMLYALTNWANNPGQEGAMTWALIAASASLFVLFVRHEDRTSQPMIDTRLLRWRPFIAVNVYNFVFGAVVFGLFAFVPYYATVAYGMTAGESGLILTPRAVAMVIASGVSSLFLIRFRYRPPMIIGLVAMSASLFLLSRGYHGATLFGLGLHSLVLLALLVMIAGMGMGISNPAASNAALDLLPEKVAVVAGLRGTFRFVGGMFGTAGIILALSYFPDKAAGLEEIFLGLAVLLLLLIPVVFLIPDTAHERRDGPG